MKSVMKHQFSQVPRADIPRSSFDRSHGLKTTFDADYLIPVIVDEILPGDSLSLNMNFFARLATPLHPILDNMYLESFFFFVPNRLLWDNWEKFCGAQDDPGDSIDFTIPVVGTDGTMRATGKIGQYMGLPDATRVASAIQVNALPFRAYNLIWNEWFRDQNLQDSLTVSTGAGADSQTYYNLVKRGKRHDYFTSALPTPQKGTAISIPLGTSAPIGTSSAQGDGLLVSVLDPIGSSQNRILDLADATHVGLDSDGASAAALGGNLVADLTNATSSTINDLRLAFQTQRLLERDMRSGTRYTETLKAHFGVTSPDFRLQRPEFLGGGSSPINVTPVAQTSGQPTPAADDKLGNLAGFGTVSGSHGFSKSFTEHGVLLGLVNVRGDITYSQGIERYWSKSTRYDFYYPVLSSIGEQSILNKEIWADASANDDLVFGYQERSAEYRYKPSRLTGLMAPDATGTLSAWHLSEDFSTLPALGDTFIQSNTGVPLDRAIAISTEPHFIADFYFQMKHARPMPVNGVPGMLDHF